MYFDKLNTIVIKIGSSLIIDEKKKIRSKWLDSFVKDIQGFKKVGKKITPEPPPTAPSQVENNI